MYYTFKPWNRTKPTIFYGLFSMVQRFGLVWIGLVWNFVEPLGTVWYVAFPQTGPIRIVINPIMIAWAFDVSSHSFVSCRELSNEKRQFHFTPLWFSPCAHYPSHLEISTYHLLVCGPKCTVMLKQLIVETVILVHKAGGVGFALVKIFKSSQTKAYTMLESIGVCYINHFSPLRFDKGYIIIQ